LRKREIVVKRLFASRNQGCGNWPRPSAATANNKPSRGILCRKNQSSI
jgi:hypothetical protein